MSHSYGSLQCSFPQANFIEAPLQAIDFAFDIRILRRQPEWIGVDRANRDTDKCRHELFSTALLRWWDIVGAVGRDQFLRFLFSGAQLASKIVVPSSLALFSDGHRFAAGKNSYEDPKAFKLFGMRQCPIWW
jgi:hypothetical protein